MSADYRIKTDARLPGTQYIPGNASAGCEILCNWCQRCARDKPMREGFDFDECDDGDVCEIIADSFVGDAVEWRTMPDGEVKCLSFVEHPQATPIRDDKTIDMFGDAA